MLLNHTPVGGGMDKTHLKSSYQNRNLSYSGVVAYLLYI